MTEVTPPTAPADWRKRIVAIFASGGIVTAGVAGGYATSYVDNIERLEGKVNVGYLDIGGIPTACSGDTVNVAVGRYYADAECRERTERLAYTHLAAVHRCTPSLRGDQLLAAGLLTVNIGAANYCGSTAARRFNAGDLRGGCAAFAPWNGINRPQPIRGYQCTLMRDGRYHCVVPGIVNRRAFETRICMNGLGA